MADVRSRSKGYASSTFVPVIVALLKSGTCHGWKLLRQLPSIVSSRDMDLT